MNISISNVINVSVQTTQQGLALPNVNTIALFSTETPIVSITDGYKVYTNPDDVITDWGSASKAAAIATSIFAQLPNPLSTGGYLTIVPLLPAERVDAAIARIKELVYFFGVLIDTTLNGSDFAAVAAYMQTQDKMFAYGSSTAADIVASTGMFDIARAAAQTHTRCLYTTIDADTALEFAAGYLGRLLSVNFAGDNTTATMHLKTISGMAVDTGITQTVSLTAYNAGADTHPSIGGINCLFTSGLNGFADEVYNELWFKLALEVAGFNYLRQTNEKIPQTDSGVEGLKNAYRSVCAQALRNRFLGRGTWTSSTTFGDPVDLVRNIADKGYYIYAAPLSSQLTADREARKAPLIQIAVKTAGAIHSSSVIVNVNL